MKQANQKILVEIRKADGEFLISETLNSPSLSDVIQCINNFNFSYKTGMFFLGDLFVVPITSTIGILLDVGNVWFQGGYYDYGVGSGEWAIGVFGGILLGMIPGILMSFKKGRARDRRYKEYIKFLMNTKRQRDKFIVTNKDFDRIIHILSGSLHDGRQNILRGKFSSEEYMQLNRPFEPQ